MKVYGTSHYFTRVDKRLCQARAIVAAKSKKRAAELLKMSIYMFNQYASETGNENDIKRAIENPETVIVTEVYN